MSLGQESDTAGAACRRSGRRQKVRAGKLVVSRLVVAQQLVVRTPMPTARARVGGLCKAEVRYPSGGWVEGGSGA